MIRFAREAGVALLVGFMAGAIFLLGHLMYAQLVLMPRLITSGSSLSVSVDPRWSFRVAVLVAVVYLVWQLRPRRGPA